MHISSGIKPYEKANGRHHFVHVASCAFEKLLMQICYKNAIVGRSKHKHFVRP